MIPHRNTVADDKSRDLDAALTTAREKMVRLRREYQAATDLDERMVRLDTWNVAISVCMQLAIQQADRAIARSKALLARSKQDVDT